MAYDIFNFLIRAIRDQDDEQILKRFVSGFQAVYELALYNAEDTRTLFSQMTTLSGDQLDYPLATFGITSDLSRRLTTYQKRKLLGLMINLWKVKAAKVGVTPFFNSVGQVRATYDEVFDWRWLLEDRQLSQEDYAVSAARDLFLTDIYVEAPSHQMLKLYVLRPSEGLLRVMAKTFGDYSPEGGGKYGFSGPDPSPPDRQPPDEPPSVLPAPSYTILDGDSLVYDILITGESAYSGIDLFLDYPDFQGDNPHWLGELGGLLDSEGFEFAEAENYKPALGAWKIRRRVNLSSEAGNAIYGLAMYNNDTQPGAYQTELKVAYIKQASGNIFPIFIEPSTWVNILNVEGPEGLTYELNSEQAFPTDWPLVKEVAKLIRPIGERFHLYALYERYDRFPVDLPSVISQGVTVDESAAVFPADGVGRIATRIPLEYLGSCSYGVSVLIDVPYTRDGSQYNDDFVVDTDGDTPQLNILLGKVSSNTFYRVNLDFGTCIATVYKSLDGNSNPVATGSFGDRGFQFRVFAFMEGLVLKLFLDGNPILRYEEPEDRLAGPWEIQATNLRLLELSALPIPAYREEIP